MANRRECHGSETMGISGDSGRSTRRNRLLPILRAVVRSAGAVRADRMLPAVCAMLPSAGRGQPMLLSTRQLTLLCAGRTQSASRAGSSPIGLESNLS